MGNNPLWGLMAILVVLALIPLVRWIFRPSRAGAATRPVDASASADLGLLTVIATGLGKQEAMERRAVLGESTIRSSMSRRRDGGYDVLVFHGDADAARLLLGP